MVVMAMTAAPRTAAPAQSCGRKALGRFGTDNRRYFDRPFCVTTMGVDNPAAKGHMVTQGVWIDGKYKLIVGQDKKTDEQAKRVQLFDIYADPAEKTNLADKLPDVVQRMQASLDVWRRDVRASYDGRDYAPENRQGTR